MAAAKSTLAARIDSAICKVILEEAVEDVGVVVEGLVGEFLDPADEAVPVDVCQSIPPRRGWGPWLVRGLLSDDPAPVSHTARLLRYEREPHLPEPVSAPAAEARSSWTSTLSPAATPADRTCPDSRRLLHGIGRPSGSRLGF